MTTRSLISFDPRITAIWPDDGESGVEHDTVIPHDGDQQQWKLVPVTPTPEMLAAVSWPGCAATDYAHMLAAAPQPPSAFPFPVSYDTASDTLTINGKRYAAGLFDERGLLAPAGTVVRIEDGPGDVVTLTAIYPPSAQADAIEAAEKAEPVAWLEGPYGEFRANPGYRIAAPQSVAWSIPLYAGTPENAELRRALDGTKGEK